MVQLSSKAYVTGGEPWLWKLLAFSFTGNTKSPCSGHLLIRKYDLKAALVQVLSEIQLEEIGFIGLTYPVQHLSLRDWGTRNWLPPISYLILPNSKMLVLNCFERHVIEPDKKSFMHVINLFTTRLSPRLSFAVGYCVSHTKKFTSILNAVVLFLNIWLI